MAAIFQMTISNACSSMKIYEFQLKLHQSGAKPNLVAKILATKIGNLWALATKIGRQY